MEALSKATGARIVTNIDDLSSEDLGSASNVEERKIGDSDMVFIEGALKPKASQYSSEGEQNTLWMRSRELSMTQSEW